ncbi:MAG TPA: OmpH family outer membrane protein [Candidatus Acidoferrum sp.]|nr:OmpH family outer membrane protein [Candidatus Acidoferrum sp.]
MNRLLGKIIPGLLLVSLLTGSACAQSRLATVDLRKVFDGYWKTKKADAQLKERAADMEKEHKTMLDDWKKGKEEYSSLLGDANNQVLSPEERDKRKKAAEDKLKQLKETEDTIAQYERQARTTLDEQRKRMRDSILEEIKTALTAKAKSAGYSLVIDTASESANNTPVVLYTNNENDMTQTVLDQLNANAPQDLPNTEDQTSATKSDKKKDEKKK